MSEVVTAANNVAYGTCQPLTRAVKVYELEVFTLYTSLVVTFGFEADTLFERVEMTGADKSSAVLDFLVVQSTRDDAAQV